MPLTLEEIEEKYKNYTPEILHYDPKVDGGGDYNIRDELLDEKAKLKEVIIKLKEKNRGNRKIRR